ncbi:alpha/beta hydrolase family protein [Deinococcus cellulosilyticus]|uniref:Alpha/beta hydrolase n=1 Tax=Deinococcus cellulosilyticus (strain DSM 18568 / NBRC 106333 / KACC 11606 / 5516J-15) TaxID=1223518 RepID=A0A511N139_DEIC1|nr:alpha/beta hydrolase [Deinococcus cellulosilyticus]GEM46594.1 hypothetical protein DC3_22290 [Deinococcus cellulosilyticus NBRC 106333 = KACC 11606]
MKAGLIFLSLSLLATAQANRFAPEGAGALMRLPHAEGDAYLWIPHSCKSKACSMMVVSHSRGNTSDATLQKPHLMAFFETFVENGVAVLISNDAGPNTWGNEKALLYLKNVWEEARRKFNFGGKTFAMGYSMGGVPATLSVQKQLYPVSALILIDARVNMLGYEASDPKRVQEIKVAYEQPDGAVVGQVHDPMTGAFSGNVPVMVIGSKDDRTVPFEDNGEKFFELHGKNPSSVMLQLPGGHLHMNRWDPDTARDILGFLKHLQPMPAPKPLEASRK